MDSAATIQNPEIQNHTENNTYSSNEDITTLNTVKTNSTTHISSSTSVSSTMVSGSVNTADISINHTASNYAPNCLKTVMLSIIVANKGPDSASGITATYLFKNNYIKWIKDDGYGSYNHLTGLWNVGTLENGETKVLHVFAQVIAYNTTFNSTAHLNTGTYLDPNSDNNLAYIDMTIPRTANIIMTQTSQHIVNYLHNFIVTFTVINKGPNSASNVTAYCGLNPKQFGYISDTRNGLYNPDTGIWTIGYMKSGSKIVMNVVTKMLVYNTMVVNTARTWSSTYDYNQSNNRVKIAVHVPSITINSLAADLAIGTKSKYEQAVNLFNWVRDHISYEFYYNTKYGAAGTLEHLQGNCVDTARLVVALARASGLSARYKHGTCYFIISQHWYGHVWANIYVHGRWYSADATSSRNTFGVIRNWDTSNFTLHGTYSTLPF